MIVSTSKGLKREYEAALEQYYAALDDGSWSDGALEPIVDRMNWLWARLRGTERQAIAAYMERRYAERTA